MQICGVAKIKCISFNESKHFIKGSLKLEVNGNVFTVGISKKLKVKSLKNLLYIGNRITFDGSFNENGFIELSKFGQAYLEPLFTKITYQGDVVSYICSDGIFEISVKNTVSKNRKLTLVAKAYSSCADGIEFIRNKLKGKIAFEGRLHNQSIYIVKFI